MSLESLSFLIVCPELAAKNRLHTVLHAFIYKGQFHSERTLHATVLRLREQTSRPYDVIFVASSFGREAIARFIQDETLQGLPRPPAVVVFINDQMQENTAEIAALYVDGVDGFISEPYTSEDLLRLLQTLKSQDNPRNNDEQKQRKAVEFMLFDAMKLVDDLARIVSGGEEARGYALRDLRNLSTKLREFAIHNTDNYSEIMTRVFEKAKPASLAELQRKVKQIKKEIPHPGSVIRQMMDARGFTEEKLLSIVRIDAADFSSLVKEQSAINGSIAHELSRVLGMSPNDWLRLQAQFDAAQKKKKPAARV